MFEQAIPLGLQIWDLAVKTGTAVLAVVGGFLGARKYLDDKKRAAEDARENSIRAIALAKVDSVKTFSAKKQEIYFDLVKTTAFISNRYNRPGWQTAVDHFWILFWGAIPIVADERVSKALDEFADRLDHPDVNEGIPLRNASMDLARACRQSLAETWDTYLVEYEKSKRAGAR
jgi:hypothetical protein